MYEQFYRLREKPFSLAPDPAFLYLAKRHQHALTMLEYVLGEASGFALITGEVGCGKTTVVRHVLERVEQVLNVGFITNTHRGLGPLLPWVLASLGLAAGQTSPSEQYRRFVEHATNEYNNGRRLVLVIDEAQNLGLAGLEELRVLSNVNAGKHTIVQTILIGQPELRSLLQRRALRQFAQRIAMEYHLEPLQPEETNAYVMHRVGVAGGRPDLFSTDSCRVIHECTGGIPRLINIVCDTALVYGFADQRTSIDADIIEQVRSDRSGVLPLKPAANLSAPACAG
jgi:general secretion pathway protein A